MQTDSRFSRISPYVVVKHGAAEEKRSSVSSGNDPAWNEETMEFAVEAPHVEDLRMTLFDRDTLTEDDFLGEAKISVGNAVRQGTLDYWVNLNNAESGEVRSLPTVPITFSCISRFT